MNIWETADFFLLPSHRHAQDDPQRQADQKAQACDAETKGGQFFCPPFFVFKRCGNLRNLRIKKSAICNRITLNPEPLNSEPFYVIGLIFADLSIKVYEFGYQ